MILRRLAVIGGIALTWMCAFIGLCSLDAFFVSYGPSKTHTARLNVGAVENALWQYMIEFNRCPPGNDDLIRGHYINTAALVDPWGTAIAYSCSSDEDLTAHSAGPDRTFGTADDVTRDF